MKSEEVRQLCQLVARLTDAVEGIAREASVHELEIHRLHNIRHDALTLARRLGG
jgi:hypothetical protein